MSIGSWGFGDFWISVWFRRHRLEWRIAPIHLDLLPSTNIGWLATED